MAWCILDLAVVVLWTTSILVSLGLVYEVYSISQLIHQPRRQKDT